MTFYDEMFNLIRDLEDRAVLCQSEAEAECLIALASAIEKHFRLGPWFGR